ncbi:MAG: RHS repeat-associated core domain-containing protein [Bacteroidales bacterium]|nr:RHS repeat-associated core domain-containing protein [Bacteroidales bacterium]
MNLPLTLRSINMLMQRQTTPEGSHVYRKSHHTIPTPAGSHVFRKPLTLDEIADDNGKKRGYETSIYFYHPDHLGTNTLITDLHGDPYQFFANLPYGETMIEQSNIVDYDNPFKFNGKELDTETGLYYYGARYYDPKLSGWLSVDPLAEKYSAWSPYVYVLNNPVVLTDPDGLTPRIYVDTQGLTGHSFVTVGEGKNTVVYSYGRYAELGKDKSSARSTTPTGEGVLIRLTGKDAQSFIKNQMINNEARAYEFSQADDNKVAEYFENQFNTNDKIPATGPYQDDPNARVVDTYNLFENNCTTKSTEAIKVGSDGAVDIKDNVSTAMPFSPYYDGKVITPHKLNKMLQSKSKSEGSGVREVKYEEVKKELNLQNGTGSSW